jgi:GMP synthase (glutamine-hydrolysing)
MTANIHAQRILILDFGSQYSQLIARRVRECGVYCELHPYDMADEAIKAFAPNGIILSGGPESAHGDFSPKIQAAVFDLACPVLGICYGMQAMAVQLGGVVEMADHREFGHARISILKDTPLFTQIEDHVNDSGMPELDVWMSHGDRVKELPVGFEVIAATDNAPYAAMADEVRCYYGLQFHPEVTHTRQGKRILEHFVHEICGCDSLWTPANIIEDSIATVQQQVGDEKVILGLSGGVDSSVVAALLHRAIDEQLTCVYIDTGLMRHNESEQVMNTFKQNLGLNIIHVDAESRFMDALAGIDEPEAKRKTIGRVFVEIFEEQANNLTGIKWLAQGTIYPDVIESAQAASGTSHVIKSHHNVGGLPEKMALKLLEPIRELFKDEVRQIGLELGLPYDMLYRHPFPGPGLGVRVLGEVKQPYVELLRQADHIFIEELRAADYYHKVSQAFAVFLPVKSVGVMGDARKYDYVIALRAVETVDFMTARWAHLPYELLERISSRIVNEINGISRVTYDISSKPPATIEWE